LKIDRKHFFFIRPDIQGVDLLTIYYSIPPPIHGQKSGSALNEEPLPPSGAQLALSWWGDYEISGAVGLKTTAGLIGGGNPLRCRR
jgi:hypothetical protein